MQLQIKFLSSKVARRIFFLFVISAIIPIGIVGVLTFNYVTSLLAEQKQEQLAASSKTYGMAIYDRLLITEDQFIRLLENFSITDETGDLNSLHSRFVSDSNLAVFNDIKVIRHSESLESSDIKHLNEGNTKLSVTKGSDDALDVSIFGVIDTVEASHLVSAKINTDYLFGEMDVFSGVEDVCIVIKGKGTLNCSNNELIAISKVNFENYTGDQSYTKSHSVNNKSYTFSSWELFLKGRFNTDSWIIYFAEPSNVVIAPAKAFMSTLLPALVLAILLVTLISLNQISKILVPLEKLTAVTKKIALSNFEEKVDFVSNDEFQDLGESFNYMSSELAEREKKLTYQAHYDFLTGLPNRKLLINQMEKLIGDFENNRKQFAYLFVDLDRFKVINDSQGHTTGDKLLVAAAERIKSCVREADRVARYGGDEFGVIVPTTDDTNNVSNIAREIIQRLSEAFYIDNYEQIISASIGISVFPRDGGTYEELIQKADIAMYKAKQEGRGKHVFFADTMQGDIREKAELEADLMHAIEREEIYLVYQPQINIESGEISGAEVLLRWKHSEKGHIRPDKFIEYAEGNGYIVSLGKWVIREAIKQCENWQLEHQALPKIAINVSAKQIRHENFITDVESLISGFDMGMTNLEFEITESLFLSDDKNTQGILGRLNQFGITLAIDDFGKGYSSLSYLKKLPAQTLKIDRLFIKDLDKNDDSLAIVKAIIAMGKALNKIIVAEGVEAIEQLNILKELGCDCAQGYYISKPKVAEEFMHYSKTAIINLEEFRSNLGNVS